ncbi:MAG: hypothetical protein LUP97_01920 [Methanoregula sp.]|nr:hypothetical protein [Methanoregula sp.]
MIEDDSGGGFRRLIPFPYPRMLVEAGTIRQLVDAGIIVIAGGGGGIPVVRTTTGAIRGVEAVIERTSPPLSSPRPRVLTSSLFWTDVKKISLHYGTKNQEDLDRVTLSELTRYMHDGHFVPGSTKPKVEAAIAFIRSGGSRVIVTRPDLGFAAIEGETGTEIVPDPGSPG